MSLIEKEKEEEEEEIEDVTFDEKEDNKVIYQVVVEDRIFSNYISLLEFTQIVCYRVDMIKKGSQIYIEGETDTLAIAIKEVLQGRCPLSLIRERGIVGDTRYVEHWEVNELRIPPKCFEEYKLVFKDAEHSVVTKIDMLLGDK